MLQKMLSAHKCLELKGLSRLKKSLAQKILKYISDWERKVQALYQICRQATIFARRFLVNIKTLGFNYWHHIPSPSGILSNFLDDSGGDECLWVLIWEYFMRAIQWVPTWQDLMVFKKLCILVHWAKVALALDGLKGTLEKWYESRITGRVNLPYSQNFKSAKWYGLPQVSKPLLHSGGTIRQLDKTDR